MTKNRYTLGNHALRVGKSKTGKGLFAKENIKKGTCIIEYVGELVSKEVHEKSRSKYLFWTDSRTVINGNVPRNTARYINHSCKPNCEADGPRGKVYILALRNIKAGEELNYDYGKEYFDEHIKPKGCLCIKCAK
jgi:uncharacterized protein